MLPVSNFDKQGQFCSPIEKKKSILICFNYVLNYQKSLVKGVSQVKKNIFAFIVGLTNYFLGSTSVLTILLKKKK